MKPPNFLAPALELLQENLDVLPATGGAVEDMLRTDVDEVEDMLIHKDTKEVTDFLETPAPNPRNIYRPTPPIYREQRHLYRFFIDGSIRTYYLATGIEGTRSFPIEMAQIGAAVMERNERGSVRAVKVRQRILLLLPKGELGVSDTLWDKLQKLNTPDGFFEVVDTTKRELFAKEAPTLENLRNRAGAIARTRMHDLEVEMIDQTNGRRDDEHWLILDGAVKLTEFIKTPHMIGVAKSFRKDPMFRFGGKRSNVHKDITGILAGLPYAHRTAVFSTHDGDVAFWYVRLREQKQVDYPLMGVVKVEYPRQNKTPMEAELADLLSQTLVAERNATPHGRDNRWHCHLYPIFLAEQAIKNTFHSKEVLMGMVRWAPVIQPAA